MENWKSEETLVLWLVIAFAFVLSFFLIVLFGFKFFIKKRVEHYKRINEIEIENQRNMLINSVEIQEKERKRFAFDLHDSLITQLNVFMIQYYENLDKEANNKIKSIITLARNISHDLHPPLIEESKMVDLIQELILSVEKKIKIVLHINNLESLSLPVEKKLHIYRLVQELIQNAIKHSQSSKGQITLHDRTNYVALIFEDFGVGFDQERIQNPGIGMKSISLRVKLLNGHYKLKSKLNQGSRYILLIPKD